MRQGWLAGLFLCLVVLEWSYTAGAATSEDQERQCLVHTRSGTVDLRILSSATGPVSKQHQRRLQAAAHQHHLHPTWGPLAQHATYLFAFTGNALEAKFQQSALAGLHMHGGSVTGYLPHDTWIITAGPAAADWMSALQNTVLAEYPPHLKIAPEWLTLFSKLGLTDVSQALHAAMQHDSTVTSSLAVPQSAISTASTTTAVSSAQGNTNSSTQQAAEYDSTHRASWLGEPRMHLRPAMQQLHSTDTVIISGDGSGSSRDKAAKHQPDAATPSRQSGKTVMSGSTQGSTGANSTQHQPRPMYLIDVTFPAYGSKDLQRLGLARPPAHVAHHAFTMCLQGGMCDAHFSYGTLLPAYAAAYDWQAPLQLAAPHCGADVVLERGRLMIAACEQDVVSVLLWLAQQPSVRWLSPHMRTRRQQSDPDTNLNAAAIIQDGQLASGSIATQHPIWAANLTGVGQVIGSGDTGIDFDSCFFFDPLVPIVRSSFSLPSQPTVPAFVNPKHRKIVFYYAYGDYTDNSGHGSHTAGTLAGVKAGVNVLLNPDAATGMAPGAKLAYIDLSGSGSSQDLILRPGDLRLDYYPYTYSQGAHVHSDSWGSDGSVYDSSCNEVDQFAYEHQDFLPVFAAGNDDKPSLEPTIRSPALAKNCMAVGATMNVNSGFSASTFQSYKITISQPVPGGTVAALTHDALILAAGFGPSWDGFVSAGTPKVLAAASPIKACVGLNAAVVRGKVLVAERGVCSVATKLANAQAAGASALIVTNDQDEGFFTMTIDSSVNPSIPVAAVPLNTGRYLWAAANTSSASATVAIAQRGSLGKAYDTLAPFSSFGPSPDGRIKPDIVAPGRLLSVQSDLRWTNNGQCDSSTMYMQGTSMATPVVAGAAALVRQYFAGGYYPTGKANPAHAYLNPSGPLVRAVLMAGASPLLGNIGVGNPTAGGLPLEPPPSVRQGWGRLDLSGSLPLDGTSQDWQLQVIDQANLTAGRSHSYCVQSTGGPLRVVLVYHDFPGDPNAAIALVNDLSLEVRASAFGGVPMLGNNWNDTRNNVEAVLIDNLPSGNVSVTVVANRVLSFASPQSYALAVVGSFSGILQSPNNPVDGGTLTSGSCIIMLAVIDDSLSTTAPLLGVNSLKFYFGTQSRAESPRGFECTLTNDQSAIDPPPYHAWKPCTSPQTYNTVPDGIYIFMVRATGDDSNARRRMIVDTTPPTVNITDPLGLSSGPMQTTATGNVTFTIAAEDASPVTYSCSLNYTGPDSSHFKPVSPNNLTLGAAMPCVNPLTLYGLYYGDWAMTVIGTDAVGNVGKAKTATWQQRYSADVQYARFDSFPPTLTNNPQLNFTLWAFTGAATGAPSPLTAANTAFEWRAWRTEVGSPGSTWTPFTGSALMVDATKQDGHWQVQARVQQSGGSTTVNEDSLARATVLVDTTPPNVIIKEQPPAISSQSVATVIFNTSVPDDGVTFACRWLYSAKQAVNASDPPFSGVAFSNCNGTQAGTASKAVQDGWWMFQVQGTDLAGNTAAPRSASFQTDLDPPNITIISYPAFTRSQAVNITYNVDDGPIGSGIANISCTMRATQLAPKSGLLGAPPASDFRPVTGAKEAQCSYPSALYAVVEGQYVFTLTAQDKAGLHTQVDLTIVLDMLPPISKVATPIKPIGQAFPSTFTMDWDAEDQPLSQGSAGINRTEFKMSQVPASAGPTLITVPNTKPAPTNTSSDGMAGRRRLQQDSPSYSIPGGDSTANVVWDTWQDGGVGSAVQFQHFVSGYYSFQVRSIDNAGNQGNASTAYVFRVDDTLPIDPNQTVDVNPGGGSGTLFGMNKIAVAVTIAVGALLVILLVIGIIVVRRRSKARHAAEAVAAAAAARQAPQPLWQGHPGGYVHAQQQWEEERMRRAIQASLEEDNLRKALEASRVEQVRDADEERLQAAIRASLANR